MGIALLLECIQFIVGDHIQLLSFGKQISFGVYCSVSLIRTIPVVGM